MSKKQAKDTANTESFNQELSNGALESEVELNEEALETIAGGGWRFNPYKVIPGFDPGVTKIPDSVTQKYGPLGGGA